MASLPTLGDSGESIEQFRGLRSQIYQFRDQAPLKTILVSSGMPAEGKTFVAANLAMSLARNKNNSVLLIDADLRRPALHTHPGRARHAWPHGVSRGNRGGERDSAAQPESAHR